MNRSISSICALFACASLAQADLPDAEKKEIADLIFRIMSPSYVAWRERVLAGLNGSQPDIVADAKVSLAKDKENIPKLRALLKVGTNVFDYPGLLSRGEISFGNSNYTLYISARYIGREAAILPWEFKLDFDDHGKITDIYDVRWK